MIYSLTNKELVLATGNKGKLAEFAGLLQPYPVKLRSIHEFSDHDPEETGTSFGENARIKALYAARASGLPSLADDSGLSVAALAGKPGIFSARFAVGDGGDPDFTAAMAKIERQLQEVGATTPLLRQAHFTCCLCLAWPDGYNKIFTGIVDGTIVWPLRGEHGFGYDPSFQPQGYSRTFAEMATAEKNAIVRGKKPISHRGRAFVKFVGEYF